MIVRGRGVALAGVLSLVVAGCARESGESSGVGIDAQGACAAAEVFVAPATASPGDPIEVSGVGFRDGCADNPGVANGSAAPREDTGALTDLTVSWTQGGTTIELATLDADAAGEWSTTVTVPEGAAAGKARIQVPPASDVEVAVAP